MAVDNTAPEPWLDTATVPDRVRDRFAAIIADCITEMLRDPDIRAEIMPTKGGETH